MKEKGADPYDLKQQENVLAESRMMIPDCRKRLEASLADLKGALGWISRLPTNAHPSSLGLQVATHLNGQAELEESNQKDGPEIDEAKSTITEVDQLFQTTEA
uniref:Tubulin-specific chaperone A n=1 Tax=Fagus sylvatica TaxID=28930 RepID=A0A2N9IY68_FAGSY